MSYRIIREYNMEGPIFPFQYKSWNIDFLYALNVLGCYDESVFCFSNNIKYDDSKYYINEGMNFDETEEFVKVCYFGRLITENHEYNLFYVFEHNLIIYSRRYSETVVLGCYNNGEILSLNDEDKILANKLRFIY